MVLWSRDHIAYYHKLERGDSISATYTDELKELTTTCIYTAMLHLMQEKSIHKIRITEVCKLAGVSRMGFYRHYTSLQDVISIHMEEQFENYYYEIEQSEQLSIYSASKLLLQYIESDKEFYSILIKSYNHQHLDHFFENFMIYLYRHIDFGLSLSSEDLPYYASYKAGGLVRLITTWYKSDFTTDIKRLAYLLTEMDIATIS